MRAIFGILGLLVVVAIVGVLAKKQLTSASAPAAVVPGAASGNAAPAPTPKQQVEQFKQAVDAAVQQPRPMPDDTK